MMIKTILMAGAATIGMMASAGADTIRIGHIDPFSGTFSNVGAVNGKHVQFGADRVNAAGGVLDGDTLEIVRFDNKASAQETVIAFQEALDDGIRIITQATSSGVALALNDAVIKHNLRNPDDPVLYLNYGSADPSLTRDKCNYYMFRFEAHSGMKQAAATDLIAADPEIKKVYIIGQDYGHGHEVSRYTKEMLAEKRPDIEIVGDEFHPFGSVKDFTPYVAKILNSGADAVVTGNFGPDLTLLVKAANSAGLKAKFFTQYAGTFGTPTAIGAAGKGRVYDAAPWHGNVPVELENEAAAQMAQDFEAKYEGDLYYTQIVVQMEMLAKAINVAGSADPTAIAAALESMEFEGATGKMHMRASDHQLIHPLFVSVFTDEDVTNDAENTGLGWKTLLRVDGEKVTDDSTCQVKKP